MLVFIDEDRSSLVQIQENRFYCAWRRSTEEAVYPRYEKFREDYIRNIAVFAEFAIEVGIGDLSAKHGEISYVNEIRVEGDDRPDTLAYHLPAIVDPEASPTFPEISAVGVSQRFTFRNSEGVDYARLYVIAEPMLADADSQLRLTLSYRGEPYERFEGEPSMVTAMRFFDEGHDQIVRAFAANTTPAAQEVWGRIK